MKVFLSLNIIHYSDPGDLTVSTVVKLQNLQGTNILQKKEQVVKLC